MGWKLFLDDERYPAQDGWIIARSSQQAIDLIVRDGMPSEIAFDHDLGGDDTSMKFIWWMIDQHYDHGMEISTDLKWSIHSQNPIGAANIRSLMTSFLGDIK